MKRINLFNQQAVFLLFTVFFVVSCSQQRATTNFRSAIDEPFENLTIGCNGDQVDAKRGGEILYASGTKLYIPPEAFVQKNGEPATGEVTINYREFHSAAEIMVSGIPMKYNNDGEIEDFVSAGMFEITAESNGEQLELARGKSIEMWLASGRREDNFNFYRFDTDRQEWVEISTESQQVTTNDRVIAAIVRERLGEDAEPVAPQPVISNLPVFELVPPETNSNLGEISKESIQLWQAQNYSALSSGELNILQNQASWDGYQLRISDPSAGLYELRINRGDDRYRIMVTPVLFGPELRKAKGEYAKARDSYDQAYQSMVTDLVEKQDVEVKTQLFLRAVTINQMGIYNCDKYARIYSTITVNSIFQLEDGTVIGERDKLFNVVKRSNGENVVVRLNAREITFSTTEKNNIVAILPGDRIAVLKYEKFRKLNTTLMRNTGQGVFNLTLVNESMASVDQLDEFLASL